MARIWDSVKINREDAVESPVCFLNLSHVSELKEQVFFPSSLSRCLPPSPLGESVARACIQTYARLSLGQGSYISAKREQGG